MIAITYANIVLALYSQSAPRVPVLRLEAYLHLICTRKWGKESLSAGGAYPVATDLPSLVPV